MSRRGFTLVEMAAVLVVVGVVVEIGMTVNAALMRFEREQGASGMAADLACDLLRRDLARGARIEGGDLVAGHAHWTVRGTELIRGAAPKLRIDEAAWRFDGPGIVVTIRPHGLPAREVRAWR